jgi:hypothetical protein
MTRVEGGTYLIQQLRHLRQSEYRYPRSHFVLCISSLDVSQGMRVRVGYTREGREYELNSLIIHPTEVESNERVA